MMMILVLKSEGSVFEGSGTDERRVEGVLGRKRTLATYQGIHLDSGNIVPDT